MSEMWAQNHEFKKSFWKRGCKNQRKVRVGYSGQYVKEDKIPGNEGANS